jgi:hypothetical protein
MEYNITNGLNVNTYNENIENNYTLKPSLMGDDIYFYPDENGNIITLTKKYLSIIPEAFPLLGGRSKKSMDIPTTFFIGSISIVGLFVLFQLSRK